MYRKRIAVLPLLIFFLLLIKEINSQSIIGLQSNYAGSNSVSLNPALLSSSHLYFDIGLANLGLMLSNDYAYIESKDIIKALTSDNYEMPEYIINGRESPFYIYGYGEHKPKNLYESLDINLLTMMFGLNAKQTLGFSLNSRLYSSADNIPWEIPEMLTFMPIDSIYFGNYKSGNTRIASMQWNEASVSFATLLNERAYSRIDIGVSLKYLMGYYAAVMNIDDLDYDVYNVDTANINHSVSNVAYSLPINYDIPFTQGIDVFDNSISRGSGMSLDFGFTYTKKKTFSRISKKYLSTCLIPQITYKWRFGASIMDLGFIKFKKNAIDNSFVSQDPLLFSSVSMDDIGSFEELNNYMSSLYYNGDEKASVTDNKFVMGLPTTLRLHFDYNIRNDFYVSAAFVQPIRLFKYSVKAVSQILIEPRYESRYFEFSLPLSLRDYHYVSIGALIRVGFLSIGTYNIANYMGIGKTNGLDLFVSVKFNLEKGVCVGNSYDACWSSSFGAKKRNRR